MNEIISYGITELWLREQAELAYTIDTIITKDDRDAAWNILKVIKKGRTGVEAKRKELTAEALKHQRNVNAQAKDLTQSIRDIEDPLAAKISMWDNILEAEKEAARNKEALRIQGCQNWIEKVKGYGNLNFGATSREIQEKLARLEESKSPVGMEEFEDDYIMARKESLSKLQIALAQATEHEAMQVKLMKAEAEAKELKMNQQVAATETPVKNDDFNDIFSSEKEDQAVEIPTQKSCLKPDDFNSQLDSVMMFAAAIAFEYDIEDFLKDLESLILAHKKKENPF